MITQDSLNPLLPTQGPMYLLSVFPNTFSENFRHEGSKTYTLKGVKKGDYSVLKVENTYQVCRAFINDDITFVAAPIPAAAVVDNLLKIWSQNLIGTKGGLGPGIIIIRGPEPTPEELQEATAKQEAYFRFLIHEADGMFAHDEVNKIDDLHRLAAEWMGTHERQWVRKIEHIETQQCPACAETIRQAAKVCRFCHTNIREFLIAEKRSNVTQFKKVEEYKSPVSNEANG